MEEDFILMKLGGEEGNNKSGRTDQRTGVWEPTAAFQIELALSSLHFADLCLPTKIENRGREGIRGRT